MSEASTALNVINHLTPHFDFKPKVKGTHFTGRRFELDFVIKPKLSHSWKNTDICFGLEFKDMESFDKKQNTKDFSKWLAQCVDYTNTSWDNYGYIYILTCPGIQTSTFINAAYPGLMLSRFLAQLGIGELKQNKYYGWEITLYGDKRLWSEKNGIEINAKRWSLVRTFGSR